MKILLIGEYSRLHLTLAEGLRKLGHEVLLASDGDGHKQYGRDVDLTRNSSGLADTLSALWRTYRQFRDFKGYDVVQIINPCFLTLGVGVNRFFFKQLKKNNKKIFLGAFGDDSYWVRACLENKVFKYSEFFVDGKSTNLLFNKRLVDKWLDSPREELNRYVANEVDGIVACLYEYYMSYQSEYSKKLRYIPLPVNCDKIRFEGINENPDKIKFFIGIDKIRAEYKGAELMKNALLKFVAEHGDETTAVVVESVSYDEYQRLMRGAHVLLDQLYSYSPSMNPLQAMAAGKVVISGGEPEMYDLMGRNVTNRPIVNVYPTAEGIRTALEGVLEEKERLADLSLQGRQFVEEYHDYVKVARLYLDFWMGGL